MKIVLLHQNFPGQYRNLIPALLARGHELVAISMRGEPERLGVRNIPYQAKHQARHLHPWLRDVEASVLRGEQVAKALRTLNKEGFVPDVVLGHTGWGETLFVRSVFPHMRIIGLCEYYYPENGQTTDLDPEFPRSESSGARNVLRNALLSQALLACDVAVCPTAWQAAQFPLALQGRLNVVHDGIMTDALLPDDSAWIRLGREQIAAHRGDEIITFVSRNLEPMRGYHQLMRALPLIMACRPKARIVIVGGDGVSYSAPVSGTYKRRYLDEVRGLLDMSRVHFVGQVSYSTLLSVLRVSDAHVYLSAPFVLSWSLLEAMSLECLVIASDTDPVKEVITHGENGVLVDSHDPTALASAVCDALEYPSDHQALRRAARRTAVRNYDFRSVCLPRHLRLIEGAD